MFLKFATQPVFLRHLKALNKYFWKYRVRFGAGILFVFLSNYFNVLSPQVTGFIIDFVQQHLPDYKAPAHPPQPVVRCDGHRKEEQAGGTVER